jgi:hypothetical protein
MFQADKERPPDAHGRDHFMRKETREPFPCLGFKQLACIFGMGCSVDSGNVSAVLPIFLGFSSSVGIGSRIRGGAQLALWFFRIAVRISAVASAFNTPE